MNIKAGKIAVVGSRGFGDYEKLENAIQSKCNELHLEPSMLISGGAKGADELGIRFAHSHNIPIKVFEPDWKQYGRAAGIIRNRCIVEACDVCFAFWDGVSKGTKNVIDYCGKINKPCFVI